jgi:hypothetical protein
MLILSLSMAVQACTGPIEDANKALHRGDYKTAYRLIMPLAEQGLPLAQYNLGVMYYNGQGVPKDYAEAAKWYRKAAEQGFAEAQTNLGIMYFTGLGVPKGYVLAHMWFTLAASRFSASEQGRREMAGSQRDFAASKMTPAQIAEAQKLAREWKPKMEK